ncbi:MAG: hypothetical protein GC180_07620 [Bacteroidetes bacterium]|nr:hypothetical protein [Bacteroidota bacterium]
MLCFSWQAQPTIYKTELKVIPYLGGEPLSLKSVQANQSLHLTTFKLYISNVLLFKKFDKELAPIAAPQLLDLSEKNILEYEDENMHLDYPDSLELILGVDSQTISNQMFFLKGDLDPIKGMYWTWHTGYVHLKMEGQYKQKKFELHLGGYQGPYSSVQSLHFAMDKNKHRYELRLHLDALFQQFPDDPFIMSPGRESARLMQLLAENAELYSE